ncbi:MAG TPA: hypothetical protein VJ787_08815 [Thermoleophilia bacterium]|nr:hypothetical protein [Thermoleophilia bacterium]
MLLLGPAAPIASAGPLLPLAPPAAGADGWTTSVGVVTTVPGWTASRDLTLALSAVSPNGAVTDMHFSQDASSWSTWEAYGGTGSYTSSGGQGSHTVYAQFRDEVPVESDPASDSVSLDTLPPETTQTGADSAWHSASVTVDFSATDAGYGHVATEYSVDGGAWTDGVSVTISTQGDHTLTFRSTDGLGNAEPTQTVHVKIDTTDPVTTDDADGAWHNGPVTVTFSATDAGGSGLAVTQYRIEGGAWQNDTSVTIGAQGDTTLDYRSRDEAGNIEPFNTVHVKIDTTDPNTTQSGGGSTWHDGPVTVTFSATDTGGSGLDYTEYSLNGGGTWTQGASATVSGEGSHTVSYRSRDNAGNVEATNTTQVRIDTTAPETTQSGADGAWHNGPVTVDFSATDTGGSGVDSTEYRVDAGAWTPGPSAIVGGQGTHTLDYRSRDNAGNVEAFNSLQVRIDTTDPTTSDDADSAWHDAPVTVHLTATDTGGSGVAGTEYRIDSGAWTDGTSFTVGADGNHAVDYRSADDAGNVEPFNTVRVKVDTKPPTTTQSGADDAWHNAPVTVTFSATDPGGSGVAGTHYRVDGGAWIEDTGVTIGANGDHAIDFYSVDQAGNQETPKTAHVKIDTTDPVTAQTGGGGDWQAGPVTVTFSATDTGGSGLAATQYRLDGGAWQTAASVSVGADGDHVLDYRSRDNAGNVEVFKTVHVRVDAAPPATAQSGADDDWHNGAVAVAFSATDPGGSGLAATEYRLDGGAWQTGSGVVVEAQGDHTLAYRSTDNAGNVEPTQTVHVKIDLTPPTTTQSGAGGDWRKGPVTVTFRSTDAGGSGVATTQYRVDGGNWQTGTSVVVNSDGDHTIDYRATDTAGNVEPPDTAYVKVDATPPATTQAGADDDWHTDWVTVTFRATDNASGVAYTEYRLDSETAWTRGTSRDFMPIDTRVTYTVYYRSVDNTGNVETTRTCVVKTEGVPPGSLAPHTTATSTTPRWNSAWQNAAVVVTLTAEDASGVAYTEYSVDGGPWNRGTKVTIAAPGDHSNDGRHTLAYRSEDTRGTLEATHTTRVSIDTTPPTTTASGALTGWHNHDVTVTLTATDLRSGVAKTEYTLDGGTTWVRSSWPLVSALANHSHDGVNPVGFRSTDLVGNGEATKIASVRIDTRQPTAVAPYRASVRRYGYVTLRYRVNDAKPTGGKANVTIRVKTLGGKTVKTLKPGLKPVNTSLGHRFRCGLPKGTYRFMVYARDVAGNGQLIVGVNRLRVY